MDPSRHYITNVIRDNKAVLFRLSTRTLTLLFWKEVLGETLPNLQSTKKSNQGKKSLHYWRQRLDIFEKQKFCQETLIQTELTNPKENRLTTPKGDLFQRRQGDVHGHLQRTRRRQTNKLKLAAKTQKLFS
jgi:hypothetical protein